MDNDKSFHDRSDGHGHSRNQQKFFVQGFSNSPKYKDERVSTPRPQGISNMSLWPPCDRCGKIYEGRCFTDREGFLSCGENSRMTKY